MSSKVRERTWPVVLVAVAAVGLSVASVAQADRGGQGGKGFGVVYVKSQGLYYDTFVPVDALPNEGPFQDIYMDEDGIGQTEFGPGDRDYVGGRWREVDPDNDFEPTGKYFLCPLLGPGRESP